MTRYQLPICAIFTFACVIAPLEAAPKAARKPTASTEESAITPKTPRLIEFDGENIHVALHTLARSAKINLVTSDDINDTVTIRVEDKTPMEAIHIIVESKDLVMTERRGVYFVQPKNPPSPSAKKLVDPDLDPVAVKEMTDTISSAVTGFYDSLLDFQARPETARKIAKTKKALYDALIAEGFTKEEAFRLILTAPELPAFNNKK